MGIKEVELRRKIISIAKREVGEKEMPENTNLTKYGKWFDLNGVMWCGIFVSYCYAHAGKQIRNGGFLRGFAGCQYFANKTTNNITSDPLFGDIVFFDWTKDGRFDHVGIFIGWNNDNTFNTIEGNTSIGNDSNGGEVMMRVRKNNANIRFINIIK